MDGVARLWKMVSCCRRIAAEEVGDEEIEGLIFRAETLLMRTMRRRAKRARKAKRGDDRRTDEVG